MDLEVALGAFLVVDHLGCDQLGGDLVVLHLVVRDQRVELRRGLVELVVLAPERVDGRDGRYVNGLVGERIVRLTAFDRPAGIRNALAAVPAHLRRHVVVDDLGAVDARAQRPFDLTGDRVLAHEAVRRDDLAPCALRRAVDHRLVGLEVVVCVPQLAPFLHDRQVRQLCQPLAQIADHFAFFCSNHNHFLHITGYLFKLNYRIGVLRTGGLVPRPYARQREEICYAFRARRGLRAQPDPA